MNSLTPTYLANLTVPPRLLRLVAALTEFRGKQTLWAQTKPEVLKRLRQVAVIESVESSGRMENVQVGPQTFDRIVREHAPFTEYLLGMVLAAYRELEENTHIDLDHGARGRMVERAVESLPVQFRLADVERLCPLVGRDTVRSALAKLKQDGKIVSEGRGRSASWRRLS